MAGGGQEAPRRVEAPRPIIVTGLPPTDAGSAAPPARPLKRALECTDSGKPPAIAPGPASAPAVLQAEDLMVRARAYRRTRAQIRPRRGHDRSRQCLDYTWSCFPVLLSCSGPLRDPLGHRPATPVLPAAVPAASAGDAAGPRPAGSGVPDAAAVCDCRVRWSDRMVPCRTHKPDMRCEATARERWRGKNETHQQNISTECHGHVAGADVSCEMVVRRGVCYARRFSALYYSASSDMKSTPCNMLNAHGIECVECCLLS